MNTLDFDTAYSALTGEHVPGQHIPTVENDGAFDADGYDVLIDGMPDNLSTGWRALKGHTRQHGYRGCVMHPSETMDDDAIREAVRDAGGDVFAIVPVNDNNHDDAACGCNGEECDVYEEERTIGWAVIYRAATPNLDPLPYTPPGYQWEGCRSAWPVLRGSVLDVFAPRQGYSQNREDYA